MGSRVVGDIVGVSLGSSVSNNDGENVGSSVGIPVGSSVESGCLIKKGYFVSKDILLVLYLSQARKDRQNRFMISLTFSWKESWVQVCWA